MQHMYDGTVRCTSNKIYQFSYGENGLDPTQTVKVDGVPQVCDIYRMANTLNMTFENKPKISKKKKKLIDQIRQQFPNIEIDETQSTQELEEQLRKLAFEEESESSSESESNDSGNDEFEKIKEKESDEEESDEEVD